MHEATTTAGESSGLSHWTGSWDLHVQLLTVPSSPSFPSLLAGLQVLIANPLCLLPGSKDALQFWMTLLPSDALDWLLDFHITGICLPFCYALLLQYCTANLASDKLMMGRLPCLTSTLLEQQLISIVSPLPVIKSICKSALRIVALAMQRSTKLAKSQ